MEALSIQLPAVPFLQRTTCQFLRVLHDIVMVSCIKFVIVLLQLNDQVDVRSSPMRLLGNLVLSPSPDPPTLSSAVIETATRMLYFAHNAPGNFID